MELPQGWFSDDNIATYRRLISQVPIGGLVCELGCWKGRSICSVADIIIERKLNGLLFDTFAGTPNEGDNVWHFDEFKPEDIEAECKANLEAFGIQTFGVHRMTTHVGSAHEHGRNLDLLFIDADHSYEAVKQDIQEWLLKVKSGGIIAGHDFTWPSVNQALRDTIWPVENESTVWWKKV